MVTLIAPVPVLKQVANRFEQWQYAEQAFLFGMDFIKHGNASIADKTLVAGNYPALFPFATSFARQLCEALELMVLLERFPQFSSSTPRYYHGGKCFFMQIEELQFFEGTSLYTKSAYYTDSETGQEYSLIGQSWHSGERVYTESFLDGESIHLADYTVSHTHANVGIIESSQQLIASAFNAAENALFAKLGLIPF